MRQGLLFSALAETVVVTVVAMLAAAAMAAPALRSPRIAAHRGGAAIWPENSLLAFRSATALGVDVLELDLHVTADGQVVVIHDPTLDRTTTGTGPVGALSPLDLQGIRLRARDGTITTERIPLLSDVLDLAVPLRVELMPEIKTGPGGQRYTGIEEKVVALVRSRGLVERTTVQAFQAETVRRVRQLEPALRTMLVVGSRQLEGAPATEAVRRAKAADATDLGLDHRVIDRALVDAARGGGLRLSAWTVNTEADMRRLLELGVDVIMSDRPDLLLKVLGRN
jgi:glycerophosphoryl diester phosphodiesterase